MVQWTNLQLIEKFENLARLYINCEKSGGLYLAEPGLMAGWLADKIWAMLEILNACCRLKHSIFCFVKLRNCIILTTLMYCKCFFQTNTATRLFYGV